ncbi:MAG TPA: hypothetical protein VF407_12420 [Polyangiaceae bacterium]
MKALSCLPLLFVLAACSSSSSTSDSGDAGSGSDGGGGGGGGGGTTQVTGTVNGQAWTGVSAAIRKLNGIPSVVVSTESDPCADKDGRTLEIHPAAPLATGDSTLNANGEDPSAIFETPGPNGTSELGADGTLTLTTATSSDIEGSVDLTFAKSGTDAGGTLSGTFAATSTCD